MASDWHSKMRFGALHVILVALFAISCAQARVRSIGDYCTLETCPSGYTIYQQFDSLDCTGNYTLGADLFLNNSKCTSAGSDSGYPSSINTCSSLAGIVTSGFYRDASCSSLAFNFEFPAATCYSLEGSSSINWCDIADVKDTTSRKVTISPATAGLSEPPTQIDGKNASQGCDISGCGSDYPTTFTYSSPTCDGPPSSAFVSNLLMPYFTYWLAVDTCYASDPSYNGTIGLTCDGESVSVSFFYGACVSASSIYTYSFPVGQCTWSGSYYYKTFCPKATPHSPSSSSPSPPGSAANSITSGGLVAGVALFAFSSLSAFLL